MYIKRLEIYGFKSFPYKVILNFSKGITAIVGPNGAGKSNILDAIKWGLGEQSPKRLRIRDLSELIYSGNSDKKIDFAEVKLVFAHDPPILEKYKNFEEISIIRRYYRDGESEFYINNKPCRLKDIHFLFLDMGINPQSYGIIDQGEIYKFLEISPKERKKFIEDLAGISKLKLVQEETEKNLSYTETNLLRLNDIIKEVEYQYFHLKEQSERAKRYLRLKEELKKLLIKKNEYQLNRSIKEKEDYLLKINSLKLQTNEIKIKLEEIENEENKMYQNLIEKENKLKILKLEFEDYKEKLTKIDEELKKMYKLESDLINKKEKEEIKIKLNHKRKEDIMLELSKINKSLQISSKKETELENSLLILKEKIREKDKFLREKKEKMNKLNKEIQAKEYEYLKLKENLKSISEKIDLNKKEIFSIEKELKDCQLILENLNKKRSNLKEREEEIIFKLKDLEKETGLLIEEITEITKNLELIKNKKEEYLRELSAIEANLKLINELTSKEEKKVLKSFVNKTFGENLNLTQEEIFLLENFYGELLKAILVNDFKDIENIIARYPEENLTFYLKENFNNLTIKIFLKELTENIIHENPNVFIYDPKKKLLLTPQGFILYLSQLKKGYFSLKKEKENLENRKNFIINKINQVKVEEIELLKKKETLEKNKNFLLNEIKNLNKTVNTIQDELKKLELDYTKHLERKNFLNLRLETLFKENNDNLAFLEKIKNNLKNLELILESLNKEKKELNEEFQLIEKETNQLNKEITDKEKEIIRLRTETNNMILRKNDLQKELEKLEKNLKNSLFLIEQLNNEILNLKNMIPNLKKDKEDIISKIKSIELLKSEIEEEISQINSKVREFNKIKKGLHNQFNKLEIDIHNLEVKIAELNLTIEKLKEEKKELQEFNIAELNNYQDINIDEIIQKIEEIKKELSNYNDVNLASIKEFEFISERYHNLLDQKKDLEKAIYDFKELLKELKEKAKKQLNETLTKVNQKLKEIFPFIMEKGSAELFFTDSDPLTAGLELKIIHPYKKIQHLHILSGGEKALCVIALLIAFYLTKPGPFCILDEVDAPLDEKNSLKFINLLKNIKEKSQIILITHNPNVMKEVDSIFGVTMEEKGVSKVVKLELYNYFK